MKVDLSGNDLMFLLDRISCNVVMGLALTEKTFLIEIFYGAACGISDWTVMSPLL